MTVQTSAGAPAVSADVISAAIHRFLPSGTLAPLGRAIAIEQLSVAAPLALYFIDDQRVIGHELLATAKFARWRALLLDGETAIGWVSIDDGEATGVSVTPIADRALTAIDLGEPLTGDAPYEAAFLESPRHAFAAIWLRGARDFVIPIDGSAGILTICDEAAITALLARPV
jgi:hypothetical protein